MSSNNNDENTSLMDDPKDINNLLKLPKISQEHRDFFTVNSNPIAESVTNLLNLIPNKIDCFLLTEKDKVNLLLGNDIGEPESQLKYAVNENLNIDRFRYGFDGNMVLLGKVMENETILNLQSVDNRIENPANISIGQRFKMDNQNYEIYSANHDDKIHFHDLKTGMDDHYNIDNSELIKMINRGDILLLNNSDFKAQLINKENKITFIKPSNKKSSLKQKSFRRKR